jgi:hypothetical protein
METVMRNRTMFTLMAAVVLLSSLFLPGAPEAARGKESEAANEAKIKRGEYLVNVTGCGDCHSPKIITPNGPEADPARLLSGYPSGANLPDIPAGVIGPDKWGVLGTNDMTAWVGPWGVSFGANLTPDVETGLGGWTEEMFIQTMRTGKHLGAGRPLLPPMPFYNIAQLDDSDLSAMFAYLKTIKPIKNAVPFPIPPAGK